MNYDLSSLLFFLVNFNFTGDKDSPTKSTNIIKHTNKGVNGNSTKSIDIESSSSNGPLWIYKPSCNNRGRGIRIVQGREALELLCYGKNTGDIETSIPPSKGIIQRYIENPLLVGVEGVKFDIRCYLLIANIEVNNLIAYYHPGYCRLSLKPYSTASSTLEDHTIHLTNASIQKKDLLYQQNKEEQVNP